jgi:anaerobic magnesium-protoporphyrin IX monomethyl ester cyclase
MSRIVLIRPPAIFSGASYSVPLTMPLALAYLAANLIKHGHEVSNIDALGEDIDHIGVSFGPSVRYHGLSNQGIIDRVGKRPDGIGVSVMFSQDWPHVEDLLGELHARYPGVPILLGGKHASAVSEYVLRSCPAISHVAIGEGEDTIVEWAEWLDGKRAIETVAGVSYLDAGGTLVANPARARNRTPDDLPWPAWHLFNLDPYFEKGEGHGVERGRSMPLVATRG